MGVKIGWVKVRRNHVMAVGLGFLLKPGFGFPPTFFFGFLKIKLGLFFPRRLLVEGGKPKIGVLDLFPPGGGMGCRNVVGLVEFFEQRGFFKTPGPPHYARFPVVIFYRRWLNLGLRGGGFFFRSISPGKSWFFAT